MKACSVTLATVADAAALAVLATAAAEHLTAEHGPGHWSADATAAEKHRAIVTSRVLVARDDTGIVGTLRLTPNRPWAIDDSFFTPVDRPLYLLDMAVDPRVQQQGIGRALLDQAAQVGRDWPADAIRLDAYDSAAGAGPFYVKCGFREVTRLEFRQVPLIYFERLLR